MAPDPLTRQLLSSQDECTLIWNTADGGSTGTIVSFFAEAEAEADAVWMTALTTAARSRAFRRDPRASVVLSGKGSPVGHARCTTLRGRVLLHDDEETRDWFFPRFAAAILPGSPRGQQGVVASMNNEANLVLQFVPERAIPYDAHAQMVAANRA